jgi:hypothetical protein
MSVYNTFCWSKQYNDDQSFQRKRYSVFNKEVGQDRYSTVLNLIQSIIPNNKNLKLSQFWTTITPHQIMELSKIPEFDKEGFEYITGLKVPDNNLSGKKVKVDIDGFTYTATID